MGFSVTGTIIALSILLPSFLLFLLPAQNKPKLNKPNIFFSILENLGRVACLAILVLSYDSFVRVSINTWFALMSLSTVAYYALWIRYILKDSEYDLLIKPLGPLPVPMAVFPTLAFAFAAVWGNSVLLFAAACVFGVGHIINCLDIYAQLKELKNENKMNNKNEKDDKIQETISEDEIDKLIEENLDLLDMDDDKKMN